MTGWELDMAFEAAEVAAGAERLLRRLGHPWTRRESECRTVLEIRLPSGSSVEVEIGPLPIERQSQTLFHPRCLLVARSETATDPEMEALRREVVLSFLRVMG
jgi:hypothetical protein